MILTRKSRVGSLTLTILSNDMKVTVNEGWSKQSKMAIVAIVVSIAAIIGAITLD
jgi:hypothetical protein